MKKKTEYIPKAVTTKITATSRTSVNIHDTFYTLEYCEERMIPNAEEVDLTQEREALWNTVNTEVDKQIEDVYNLCKK